MSTVSEHRQGRNISARAEDTRPPPAAAPGTGGDGVVRLVVRGMECYREPKWTEAKPDADLSASIVGGSRELYILREGHAPQRACVADLLPQAAGQPPASATIPAPAVKPADVCDLLATARAAVDDLWAALRDAASEEPACHYSRSQIDGMAFDAISHIRAAENAIGGGK